MVDCMVEEVAWEIRKHPKLWDTCLGHADVAIMYNPDQVILTALTIKITIFQNLGNLAYYGHKWYDYTGWFFELSDATFFTSIFCVH